MAEIFFTIFLFIAITGVTAVLFGGWVIFSILKLAWRAGGALRGGVGNRGGFISGGGDSAARVCGNARCRAANPAGAKFCRRCGQPLGQTQQVAVRRAAMW
ncbi:MAG TPA: zinc ribbon domain-containing protein [Tepidisphaeraceae bacterium]|nr:zinc ribbon domain-containing protein [Tepidisphaeraceae bacterium]